MKDNSGMCVVVFSTIRNVLLIFITQSKYRVDGCIRLVETYVYMLSNLLKDQLDASTACTQLCSSTN